MYGWNIVIEVLRSNTSLVGTTSSLPCLFFVQLRMRPQDRFELILVLRKKKERNKSYIKEMLNTIKTKANISLK